MPLRTKTFLTPGIFCNEQNACKFVVDRYIKWYLTIVSVSMSRFLNHRYVNSAVVHKPLVTDKNVSALNNSRYTTACCFCVAFSRGEFNAICLAVACNSLCKWV